MTEAQLTLAGEYPPATLAEWRALADEALNGAPFEKRLVTTTADGFKVNPLYTLADLDDATKSIHKVMIAAGNRRAPTDNEKTGWDIRQLHAHPDPRVTNEAMRAGLEQGATSVHIVLDPVARNGGSPQRGTGEPGVMLYGLEDAALVLKGLYLGLATISVDAGAAALPAAALFVAAAGDQGADARFSFNCDPLRVLASTGSLPVGVDEALDELGAFGRELAAVCPQATAVGVDSTHWFNAGATDATELAVSLATAVTYLRALDRAGISVEDAARTMTFSVAVGTDFFAGIAKVRALRLMWRRVLEASGAPEGRVTINAVAAEQVLSKADPWVNLLRTTVTTFAAGVGGADSVVCLPFDHAIGVADEFSRRLARNTQLILEEESNVHRVLDPAGGSWYLENHTRLLGEAAWQKFQAIERDGGIANKIVDGTLAGEVNAMWRARRARLATRLEPLTGVSEFPNIDEPTVTTDHPDLAQLREQAAARTRESRVPIGTSFAELVAAAKHGASIALLFKALYGDAASGPSVPALPRHRLAEDFEVLRERAARHAAATGSTPSIFLANIGRVAEHTARATFARSFFEAGGIRALGNDGFATGAEAGRGFADSSARIAVICGSDGQYGELAVDFATNLRKQGASRVYLAGKPGDAAPAYKAAGIDDFVFVGVNLLDVCKAALDHLGVEP